VNMMDDSELIMEKVLDAYLLALQAEKEPVQRDIILGKMVKEVGYIVGNHCQNDRVNSMRINLTLGGIITGLTVISGVLWWLVQKGVGG